MTQYQNMATLKKKTIYIHSKHLPKGKVQTMAENSSKKVDLQPN